jgi:hypothetical protein
VRRPQWTSPNQGQCAFPERPGMAGAYRLPLARVAECKELRIRRSQVSRDGHQGSHATGKRTRPPARATRRSLTAPRDAPSGVGRRARGRARQMAACSRRTKLDWRNVDDPS